MRKDYEFLRQQYPEIIGLEQMRVICKIAKRSAAYLLNNGIVPCDNSGKKTRQYSIRLDDVITYLQEREKWGSRIPCGAVSSGYRSRKPRKTERASYAPFICPGMEKDVAAYFSQLYSNYPDVLTIPEISEMTGICRESIRRYVKKGSLKSDWYKNHFIIAKSYLIDFTTTRVFLEAQNGSDKYLEILGGFELWLCQKY